MAITVYSDIVFAMSVMQAGVRGQQMRRNSRVKTSNGQMAVNIIWSQTLRLFEVGIVPLSREDWQYLEQLHEITEGGAYGILLQDPKDSVVEAGQGVVQSLTSTTFQLYKRYLHTTSGRYKDRKITRPSAAHFTLYISGVESGSYTLDEETGIVTIASAPLAAAVTWTTGLFYVPVHFRDDTIDWEIVGTGQTADVRYVAGPNVVLEEVRE